MGRTPKPLRILVIGRATYDWPEIQALAAQGHVIEWSDASPEPDLVLGPACHMMTEAERPWLKEAIAAARKRRYGVPLAQEEESL